ncbi:MAG: ABC transporter permease [Victivallaceae bacterium]|nr:ABC transporter permease [Victivallaceae bacterium]
MRVELFLARRYLRPKRNEVSIITLISIVGVMLGVAVLIVVLAVMTGFSGEMRNKMLQTQPHLHVSRDRYVITDTEKAEEAIRSAGGRAARMITAPVFIQRGDVFEPQGVLGIEFDRFREEMDFRDAIVAHLRPDAPFELLPGEIIISSTLAKKLDLRLGSRVQVHSTVQLADMVNISSSGKISVKDAKEVSLPAEFTVAALCHFGKYDFDSQIIFMDLNDAADLFRLPWNCASEVAGWLNDPAKAADAAKQLRAALPGYDITTWEERNQLLISVLNTEKQMMFFLLVFIVLVAAFSISNNLITSVYQKTREIGLLKALGATNGQMMRVFVFQGLLVGMIGTGAGVGLGTLVVTFRMAIMNALAKATGREIFPKSLYQFDELPAEIVGQDLMLIVLISVALCTVGGLIPAWRAAKLDPAKAFRDE